MAKENPRGQHKFSTQTALRRRGLRPVGVIGDMSPVEHGGGVVYEGPSGAELHMFGPYDDDVSVYIIDVAPDVMKELDWVDWNKVAQFQGMDIEEIREAASSGDSVARASVYDLVGSYHGFGELDPNQQEATIAEIDRRYDKDIDKAHQAAQSRRRNPAGKKKRTAGRSPPPGAAVPGRDWHVIVRGPEGVVSTTAWESFAAAVDAQHDAIDEFGVDYSYEIVDVGGKKSSSNPRKGQRGKHIACGKKTSKKDCRQLQHVYESARKRGPSKTSASQQAWGSLRENPGQLARRLARGG